MTAHLLFILSFSKTTIANTLYTLSSIPFKTLILSFIFLKERIGFRTFILMISAFFGIYLMVNDSLNNNGIMGSIFALGCAICFSCFIIIVRKCNSIDMLPTSLLAGISLSIVTFIISFGNIVIPTNEILLCLFWGEFLHGLMNIVFIFSTRYFFASEVTLFMLIEFCLGPFWVWIFFDKAIANKTLFGGLIVLLSVTIFSFLEIVEKKIK